MEQDLQEAKIIRNEKWPNLDHFSYLYFETLNWDLDFKCSLLKCQSPKFNMVQVVII